MRSLRVRMKSDATGDQYGDIDDGPNAGRRRRSYEKEPSVAGWAGDSILNVNSSNDKGNKRIRNEIEKNSRDILETRKI